MTLERFHGASDTVESTTVKTQTGRRQHFLLITNHLIYQGPAGSVYCRINNQNQKDTLHILF